MLLNCHTYYSYKYGTLSIDELFKEVKRKGYDALALTDINSTSAVLDVVRKSGEHGIRPVIGIDFRKGAQRRYIGIAKNNQGYRELTECLTLQLHTREHVYPAPDFKHVYVIYPYNTVAYEELKDHEYIGVRPAELNKVRLSKWKDHQDKLVLMQPVTFRDKQGFNAHRLLRAIDNNTLLSKLPKSEEASPDEVMWDKKEVEERLADYPVIRRNTEELLGNCHIDFEFKTPKNKSSFTGSEEGDAELIYQECLKGLIFRFGEPSKAVITRFENELKVIKEMNFCAYFLINWDMLIYARSKRYPYVGRGSGANSMVAYLLRITDVDPLELDLYFERFINPSRKSMPDFDLDFSSRDRNDVTKYLFDRHGWEHTALCGTYITFQYRSMLRELGKVFGLPSNEIERLQKAENYSGIDEIGRLVIRYSKLIEGFPSHLSVHSSGVLISEEPLSAYTATMMPPKGFPTAYFSMLEAEDIGLAKFDILGQRGLSKITDARELILENTGDEVDINDIAKFKQDEKVKELLRNGLAIGCFYVESPAMRMLLTKLQADDYLRLVAASSIIRPGIAKSGMMREYILRYRHPERREAARKALPELYDIMAETYGVMVYQEDVIKVAHYFADLTLAEADVLRRGMSWKFNRRNEFDKIKTTFFNNCEKKGYTFPVVSEIWRQIESFANYAFSKGHSASYAVESYQALYLKAHYPLEYMVATVNNGGGFYRPKVYIHEARMNGAQVEVPCVNKSMAKTAIYGKVIYLGFGLMRDLSTDLIYKLLIDRCRDGVYKSLLNFIERVPVSLDQVRLFIRVGAFRFTGKRKKELLWEAHFLMGATKKSKPQNTLFEEGVKEFKLPPLYYHKLEDAYDEIEILHFSVTVDPFDLVEELPNIPRTAKQIPFYVDQIVEIIGYLIHVKGTSTSGSKFMSFGVFVDQEGHWIDTVQFPEIAKQYPFRGPGCYVIKGKVINEFGFVSIEVKELYRLPNINLDVPSTKLKAKGAPMIIPIIAKESDSVLSQHKPKS